MEGEDQVRNLFENNLIIKIISLVAAIFLWLVVYNIENPYNEKTFTLQLDVINEDTLVSKGLRLMNYNFRRNVDIVVRGRSESLNKVTAADFRAVLDFSKVESEKDTRIEIDGPYEDINDVYISKVQPTYIDVELEKVVKRSFPIELKLINMDQIKEGYQIIETTLGPEEIELEAVESIINSISHVEAQVDVKDLDSNKSVLSPCTVYNKRGERIDAFKNINVNVTFQVGKTVPVVLVTEGTPAEDFREGIKSINPERVIITGSNELMSGLSYVVTEPVSIDGVDSDVKTKAKLKLPEGIKVVNTPGTIDVNIMIDKLLVKRFQVNKNNISLVNFSANESYYYEILNDTVTVEVKGERQFIQSMGSNDISIRADVAGLRDGVHTVPVRVALPENVLLVKNDPIQVKILRYKTVYIEPDKIQLKNRQEGKVYTFTGGSIEVILRGMQDELDKINADTLKPSLSVSGLEVGRHIMPLEITYPGSVTLVKSVLVELRVENLQ